MKILLFPALNEMANVEADGGNYTAGIIIAVLILLFLIYTLLKPEKF